MIKDGSHAKRIIKLLLCTGEFPYYSLGILGEIHSIKRAVKRMSEVQEVRGDSGKVIFYGKIVNISGKGQLKTVRLNAYAFTLVESIFPEMMEYYRYHTRNHRFRGDSLSVDRNHRVAESIAMFLMAGVDMFPNLVPELKVESTIRNEFVNPVFYHCRHLKTIIEDELKKNQYTRIVGSVFYESGCYAVYNTRDTVMKLSGEGEGKTRKHLEEIAKANSYCNAVDNVILFGKTYENAERTLMCLESNPKERKVFGHIYHHYHFIPLNSFGVKLIQLYTTPYWMEDVLSQLFDPHERRQEMGVFQYDGKVDGTYYVSFLDSDIAKLRSVNNHIKTKPTDLVIVCFEEQIEFLKTYMGENIRLKIISIDEMLKTLDCERRHNL